MMMKTVACLAVMVLVIAVCAVPAGHAQDPNQKYLAPLDFEKVGMKGVKLIPRMSKSGAGGDLNFTDATGELILMVQITSKSQFEGYKKMYAKSAVSAVGEQAIQGAVMQGFPDGILVFTKGVNCVALTSFGDFLKKTNYLTMEQLIELGKIIASRM
jgi:hypothetical protein